MTKTKQSGHEKLRKALEGGGMIDLNNLPIDPADEFQRLAAKAHRLKKSQEKKQENPK
jgi:hypothetical protein